MKAKRKPQASSNNPVKSQNVVGSILLKTFLEVAKAAKVGNSAIQLLKGLNYKQTLKNHESLNYSRPIAGQPATGSVLLNADGEPHMKETEAKLAEILALPRYSSEDFDDMTEWMLDETYDVPDDDLEVLGMPWRQILQDSMSIEREFGDRQTLQNLMSIESEHEPEPGNHGIEDFSQDRVDTLMGEFREKARSRIKAYVSARTLRPRTVAAKVAKLKYLDALAARDAGNYAEAASLATVAQKRSPVNRHLQELQQEIVRLRQSEKKQEVGSTPASNISARAAASREFRKEIERLRDVEKMHLARYADPSTKAASPEKPGEASKGLEVSGPKTLAELQEEHKRLQLILAEKDIILGYTKCALVKFLNEIR